MHVAWNKLECGYAYIYIIDIYIPIFMKHPRFPLKLLPFASPLKELCCICSGHFSFLGEAVFSQELSSAIIVSHIPLYIYLYIFIYIYTEGRLIRIPMVDS